MLPQIDVDQVHHCPDQLVDIDLGSVLRVPFEHRFDVRDDFACAMTGGLDLIQRDAHLVQVRLFGREPTSGRTGPCDNSRQGLIDLMGDRGRQLPCCRHAIHMGQFGHGIASEDLGTIATSMLIDQPGDQRDLHQKNGADRQNFRTDIVPMRSDRERKSRFPAADGSR